VLGSRKIPDRAIECTQVPAEVKLGLAGEILRSRSVIRVRAFGTSMLPTIWPGDVLVIENRDPAEICVGDIIGFTQAGRFLIHRVIGVGTESENISWITRGDSLTREDLPVLQTHLLGRIAAIHRNGRAFPPPRRVSGMAHWLGRMLHSFDRLDGLILRFRFFWGRDRDFQSDLVKASR
jgi:signal peptidase I